MIHLTDADREKLTLIDDIFRTIPPEVIKKWSEADRITEILKEGNAPKPNGVVLQIVEDNIKMSSQLIQMQADLLMLRNSIQTIVRIMGRPQFDYQNNSDFGTLKSSLGIY